jgi:hypothetical protein
MAAYKEETITDSVLASAATNAYTMIKATAQEGVLQSIVLSGSTAYDSDGYKALKAKIDQILQTLADRSIAEKPIPGAEPAEIK